MSMSATMPGPTGVEVTAYRRSVRQVHAGDWLPDYAAHAVTDPVQDPDDDTTWVTLDDGRDIQLRARHVWLWRRYTAPAWVSDALTAYRSARDARTALRESSQPVPPGLVAGAAGANVAWCQLEDSDFAAAYPAPRLAEFIKEAAAAWREPEVAA